MGCTGSPADSHELNWITLRKEKHRRCPECGSGECRVCSVGLNDAHAEVVYALDYQGPSLEDVHHHH